MADASAAATPTPNNNNRLDNNINDTVVLLFYKYVALSEEEVGTLCEWMLAQGSRFGLTGRVLLAVEGINANVAGSSSSIRSFCDGVNAHASLQKEGSGRIDLKLDSVADKTPHQLFPDFKVQQKKEICSTGNRMPFELLGAGMGGKHLDPKEFHAVLQEYWTSEGTSLSIDNGSEKEKKKELVVIDVRNRKEYDVGRFEHVDVATGETRSAVDPNTKLFNDWAAHFAEKEAPLLRDKKVLMYCTGGIRCEKASAYLRSLGVSDVSQLKGGIHRYIEEFGNGGFFKGKNYIFDSRGLQDPISLKQQQLARDTNTTTTGTPTPPASTSTDPSSSAAAPAASAIATDNSPDQAAQNDTVSDNSLAVTDKPASAATQVVGKCFSCGVPEEQVTCDRVCAVCRDGVLVCDTCRQARRGFYYCRDHVDLESSYAPHLDNLTAVQTPNELNRQIAELEALRKNLKYLGRPNYNRRRTVAKQVGRLKKLVNKLQTDALPEAAQQAHDETVGRRMCVHGKVFPGVNGQPDDSAAKANVLSREGCVPRCRCCGKFGPKDLLEQLWGDRSACGCQEGTTEEASASVVASGVSPGDVNEDVHKICLGESGVFVITGDNKDNDNDDDNDGAKDNNVVAGIKRRNTSQGDEGGGGNSSKKPNNNNNKQQNQKNKKTKPTLVFDETEYEISTDPAGPQLRKVIPYVMEYDTFAKRRWLGRTVQEMFLNEFGANSPAYYASCIRNGLITVNNAQVPDNGNYIIKDGDLIIHATHRHEPPVLHVTAADMVAHENESVVIANKPASVPVHPCGAYRYNSLTVILAKEWPSGGGHLKTIHRLDRLTSGIVILAKSRESAQRLSIQMKAKSDRGAIAKVYVAKVHGRFPANANDYKSHPDEHEPRLTTVLQAHPEFGKPASAMSVSMRRKIASPGIIWGEHMRLGMDASVAAAAGLGDEMSPTDVDVVTLSCPLRCRSHKHGVWECSLVADAKTGDSREGEKPSMSRFKLLRYDAASNTSVVQAEPVTGRTHQLRLHLQVMGFPILNDPNYGGAHVVHGGDEVKPDATDDVKEVLPKSDGSDGDASMEVDDDDAMMMDASLSLKERVSLLCLHCNDKNENEDAPFSHDQLRHHGLCLHAHRYACMQEGEEPEDDLWDWAVPLPKWAHYD